MRSVYGLLIAALFLVGCDVDHSKPNICKCYCNSKVINMEEQQPNAQEQTRLPVQTSI